MMLAASSADVIHEPHVASPSRDESLPDVNNHDEDDAAAEPVVPLWSIYDPQLPRCESPKLHPIMAWAITLGDGALNRCPRFVQRLAWRMLAPTTAECPPTALLSGDLPVLCRKGLLRFVLDELAAQQQAAKQEGRSLPWVEFRLGPVPMVMPLRMDLTMQILLSPNVERGIAYSRLTEFFGYGIFTSRIADRWRYQRDIIIDLFRRKSLEAMAIDLYQGMLQEVRKAYNRAPDEPVDLVLLLSRMGLIAFCDTALGVDVRDMSDELAAPINRLLAYINGALEPICIPFGDAYHAFVKDRDFVHNWMMRLMRRVREAAQQRSVPETPLAKAILDMQAPEQQAEVVEFMISMVLGGHETTARLMLGTMYALLRNPRYIDQVRVEVAAYLKIHPEPMDYNAYGKGLPVMRLMIEEAVRLYPPVWLCARTPKEDMEVGGRTIHRGEQILISPLILQRQHDFWGPDSETFRPERFSEFSAEQLKQFRPFVAGPEQCPGREFAKLESVLAIAGMLHHFDVTLADPTQREEPTSAGTFRLFRELFVKLKPRTTV